MSTATANGFVMARRIFDSTIGQKFVMAITGAIWVGFVVGHMIGNLQVFIPPIPGEVHPLNEYAHFLQNTGGLLWIVRAGLLVTFALHVRAAIRLKRKNDAARPVGYERKDNIQANKPSYYMTLSGLTILAFLLYHLAHFTLGVGADGFGDTAPIGGIHYHDVYTMVIKSFANPVVAGLYIVANILLGLHLSHAASSMFQTLGWRVGGYVSVLDKVGPAIAVIVIAGNVSIPLSIWLGIVGG